MRNEELSMMKLRNVYEAETEAEEAERSVGEGLFSCIRYAGEAVRGASRMIADGASGTAIAVLARLHGGLRSAE